MNFNTDIEKIKKWCVKNGVSSDYVEIKPSTQPQLADFSCNIAHIASGILKRSAGAIANELMHELPKNQSVQWSESRGFLNAKLSSNALLELAFMDSTRKSRAPLKPATCLIDYGGPNLAKPMHVGHLRSLVIGQSLQRIASRMAINVESDIHFGDWGLQMGLLLAQDATTDFEIDGATVEELSVAYTDASARSDDAEFMELAHSMVLALQRKEAQIVEKWQQIMRATRLSVDRDLARLGVKFTHMKGESDSAPMLPMIAKLAQENEGSLVLDQDDPPTIVRNKHGGWLYAGTDLATLGMRTGYDLILYVVDQRQHFHFERVFKHGAKITDANLEHIGFGTVNGADGKPFKTREGGVPALSSLIDQAVDAVSNVNPELDEDDKLKIAMAAIKFADLINKRTKNYSFDIDRATSITGKTGVYVCYQAVRARKCVTLSDKNRVKFSGRVKESERQLLILLTQYDRKLQQSWETRMPHHLAQYLYDLAAFFSSWYSSNYIMGDNRNMTIADEVYQVLKDGLWCLGISLPTQM